ncbi:MAG: hypothetical protein ACR2OR_07220 [Hyphomicrobiales bacterium]
MPKMFSFLLTNASLGIVASWALLAAMLWADVWGLGSLVARSADGILAVAMLGAGFAITFGSAAIATATLMMRYEDDGDGKTTIFRFRPNLPKRTGALRTVKIHKR